MQFQWLYSDTKLGSSPAETNHTPIGTGSLPELLKEWILKEPDANWIAAELECSSTIDTLIQDFRNDKAIAVSDGSFHPEHKVGTAAWTIESWDGTEYIRGGGRIPGHPEAQGSYRSELGGLLGIAIGVVGLEKLAETGAEIIVGCDGESALHQSMTKNIE